MIRPLVSATLLLLVFTISPLSAQWYISPSGSDTSAGSQAAPFKTINKANAVASAGDTLYLVPGTHPYTTPQVLSRDGSLGARLSMMPIPGGRALLDFSGMVTNSGNRGLRITGDYWYVYGVDIKGAGDNGLQMPGSNNIVEFCTFFENRDSGVQLDNGASNNHFINCDSYFNSDPGFENADGFAAKLTVGSGNVFSACRAWQNADDGWDGYLRGTDNVTTTLERCWSFMNGFLKDGTPSLPNGDGNGFKMGGSDDKTLHHDMILKQCVAFDNRVKGFDQNNNRGSMTLLNCTSYRNGTNYSLPGPIDTGRTITITNSVAFGSVGTITASSVLTSNSWSGGFSVTASDFISIDTTGIRGPRAPDGSLPIVGFLHLAAGSDLINAGTDVGIEYVGQSPDLGAFEFDPGTSVLSDRPVPSHFFVSHNYPNPFNPSTHIDYTLAIAGNVDIRIYDVSGRCVAAFVRSHPEGGRYTFRWDASSSSTPLPSGLYIAALTSDRLTESIPMILLR